MKIRLLPYPCGLGLFYLILWLNNAVLRAQTIAYPANAGVLNVKNAPYNAVGNGTTDDTQAIQKALADALNTRRYVYLPNGTYLVSNTLKWNNSTADNGGWGSWITLQGQSQAGTVIKLKDNTFTDPSAPKALIMTGSRDDQARYDDANGEGNQAFGNYILDLTVDIGSGNPGAIGVDYQVSNYGAMRNVTVKSSDATKAGYCGINLRRRDNGPGMIEKVSIDGFQYGIQAGQEIAQFTLESIMLTGQSVVGVEDTDAIMAIRKLTSVNSVPAVRVGGNALLNLLDASLTGGSASSSAIELLGDVSRAYLRGITTNGYASAVRRNGTLVNGTSVSEWVSDPVLRVSTSDKLSLNLPVEETPGYFDPNLGNWGDVGAPSGSDDADAIQAVLNSGKSTVYFRAGTYRYSRTLTVPASVKHLLGLGSVLMSTGDLGNVPLFQFVGGTANDVTVVERFDLNINSGYNNGYLIEHASLRTLVLKDIGTFNGQGYRNQEGAGKLFADDVSMREFDFFYPQQAWLRQYNPEGYAPMTYNNGATVWILGLKVESTVTFLDSKNGGRTEIFGGLTYSFGDSGSPAILNEGSQVAASFGGTSYVPNGAYANLVREVSGSQSKTLPGSSAYGGRTYSVPMYVGILPKDKAFYRINAGGGDAFPYMANAYSSGNTGTYFTTDLIDVSGVADPAPQSVYQSEANDLTGPGGSFTYTVPKLTPAADYRVRLHFVERYFTQAGGRRFNVAINGVQVLGNFDIYADAGAQNKALIKEFIGTAKSDSTVVLSFTSVTDRALVNGIEILESLALAGLRPADNPDNSKTGLNYRYYEGNWSTLPDFTTLSPLKSDAVSTVDMIGLRNTFDFYGLTYTGYIDVPQDGMYTFYTSSDDGTRLSIGSTVVVNNDGIHYPEERSGTIGLRAGKHAISVQYFETSGTTEVLDVSYSGPGIAKQAIPATALFRIPVETPGQGTGLLAEYYNNKTLTEPSALKRTDGIIKFNWGDYSPAPGSISTDNFSVRWSGQVEAPATGSYTFSILSDDGARLWVNGQQLINRWVDGGSSTTDGTPVSLTAGQKYSIVLEYYETVGGAQAQLFWSHPGQTQQPVPQKRLFPANQGNGLFAEYFDNADLTNLKITRNDPTVNFNWAGGSPDPGIDADRFSARWTGVIQPRYSGTYTFYLTSDNGRRLWINDQLIIDQWINNWDVTYTGTVTLEAGRKYRIKVEYFEDIGAANIKLEWSSTTQLREVVPQSQLFPFEDGTGLLAQYYDNQDLTNLKVTRVDPVVNFDWGTGAPAQSLDSESFSARWTGSILPRYSEQYTFYINSDNGRRVWINDSLIIDKWIDDFNITYSGSINLQANKKYTIKVEYFESFGGAGIKLEWASASQLREVIPQSQLYPAAAGARLKAEEGEKQAIGLTIYPNPTSGEVMIYYTPERSERVQVNLYNIQGKLIKLIYEGNVEKGVRQEHRQQLGESIRPGLYIIRLITAEGATSRKLLLNR